MNLFFIERYIKKITKEDLYNYALAQGITLTSNEVNTLHYYLQSYYKPFLTNPSIREELLSEIKSQISPQAASKLDELYNLYKYKI